MARNDRKSHKNHEDVDAKPVEQAELDAIRKDELMDSGENRGPNVFVGTMNVFSDSAKAVGRGVRIVCDPVLKVCYPVAKSVALPVRTVCDPVLKVCYPPLQSHWQRKYKQPFPKHAGWVLALDLSLMFLLGSLVVGLMFVKLVLPGIPQPDIVSVAMLRPNTVVSGEATTIILSYANESADPLAGAEIRVELPDQFIVHGTTPDPLGIEDVSLVARTRFLRFFIGSVPGEGRGEIRIDGTLYAPLGSQHGIASEFLYWKEGDTSPERAASFHTLAVTDSQFELGITFDKPFLRGSRHAVRVSYGNQSDAPIENAEIRLSTPSGFTTSGSAPYTQTPGVWQLGTLEPGERGTLTVYGILSESAVPSFIVRGYTVVDEERLLAQEIRGNVDAVSTGFIIGHDVATHAARPGDTINVTVRYHNAGEFTLKDVTLRLETTDRYLVETVPAWSGGELLQIEPDESGTLTAKLKVLDDISPELLEDDIVPVIRISAVSEYALEDDPTKILRTDSGVSEVGIATKLGLESASIYLTKDGDQLGIGPLPPKAGESTRFWAVIKVTNGTSAVRAGHLEATLPPNVRWTGRFSVTAGDPLVFLTDDRKIIWNIGSVPAFSDGAHAGASFELTFTPDAEDVGATPPIVENIRLTADDDATGLKVHATAESVTTGVRFGSDTERAGVVTD